MEAYLFRLSPTRKLNALLLLKESDIYSRSYLDDNIKKARIEIKTMEKKGFKDFIFYK